MKKILVVNTVPTERNGITSVMMNYYRAMDKNDIVVDFVFINNPEQYYKDELSKCGSRYYVLSRSISKIVSYIYKLSKIARNYDVMHVHGNSATMAFEMFAAKLGAVKLRIAHGHSSSCEYKLLDKLLRFPFYSLCNCRLTCGEKAGNWLYGKRGYNVMNNGISTPDYAYNESARCEIRKMLLLDDSSIVIGHVGNFLPVKNHNFLIDVFSHLASENDRYRLVLLGSGYLQQQIEQKVKELGLENKVFFLGSVNNVGEYLSVFDVAVMPSLYEGFPLTIMEEQASGLNCVVSDIITREVDVTGNVHFVSLSDDADVWAKKIRDIVNGNKQRDVLSCDAIKKIKENGYDMFSLSENLKRIYLKSI